MNLLGTNFFRLSNAIFHFGLSPIQLAVYGYLVSCTGNKEKCWLSMRAISVACGCSKNAARAAVDMLARRSFIRKTPTYRGGLAVKTAKQTTRIITWNCLTCWRNRGPCTGRVLWVEGQWINKTKRNR